MRSTGYFAASVAIALAATACRNSSRAPARPRAPVVHPIERHIAVDPSAPVVQIASGRDETCALFRDGHVACWGDNAFTSHTLMQTGIPDARRTTPQRVENVANAVEISVGTSHGCARLADGSASCWLDHVAESNGANTSLTAAPTPELAHAIALTSSLAQTCALRADGNSSCAPIRRTHNPLTGAPAPALQIAIGNFHGCQITASHTVQCWGTPRLPALGPVAAGADLPGLASVDEIAAGEDYSCARSGGAVFCWGASIAGQTGRLRNAPDLAMPNRIAQIEDATALSLGVYHVCALRASGEVACWGDNRFGQRGSAAPLHSIEGLANVVQIAIGEWHSCALTRSGEVLCWGQNQRGQLGDGGVQDRAQPAPVRFAP